MKRGYAYGYFPDESPSDVMAFPPPTPYKGSNGYGHKEDMGSVGKSRLGHAHSHSHMQPPHHHTAGKNNALSANGGHHHHHHQHHSRFEADFDVVSVIGSGSFGEVYQARSRVDGVEYAVKCTRRRFKGQADRDRYLQEVKALAKVCNSDSSEEILHVVRYHQAWIEDERLYMQTELCETSLDKLLLQQAFNMSYDDVFDFLRQMLLALDVLHRNGLVHLDIKVCIYGICMVYMYVICMYVLRLWKKGRREKS